MMSHTEEATDPISNNPELNKETPAEVPMTAKELSEAKRINREYYKNQIALLKPQVELMELRWKLSKYTLENYLHGIKLNEIQNGYSKEEAPGADPELIDHQVTQEDLDNNPDMVAAGLKVGDTIQLRQKTGVAAEKQGDLLPGEFAINIATETPTDEKQSTDESKVKDTDGSGND